MRPSKYAMLWEGRRPAVRRTFTFDVPPSLDLVPDRLVKDAIRRWARRHGFRAGVLMTDDRLKHRQIVVAIKARERREA
jgi:hypothetical protein